MRVGGSHCNCEEARRLRDWRAVGRCGGGRCDGRRMDSCLRRNDGGGVGVMEGGAGDDGGDAGMTEGGAGVTVGAQG